MSHLIDSFNSHFELIEADTEELLKEVFRIRYQVYCIEEKLPDFEKEKFPNGIEQDRHDEHSIHTLIRHRPSGDYIGTVRLVLSDPFDPDSPFPLEQFAGKHFYENFDRYRDLPRAQTAEISRLIVKKHFRSSPNRTRHPYFTDEHLDRFPEDRRNFQLPLLGILAAILRMTIKCSVTHWYAGMEPSLHKRLARIGYELDPIGPAVEYHGRRRPYVGDVQKLVDNSYSDRREIWDFVTDNGRLWAAPEFVYGNRRIDLGVAGHVCA